MGFKIPANWIVDSITPEGAEEWIAESCNVCVAKAAYEEALKHRYGRVVRFRHGRQILRQEVGTQKDWWQPNKEVPGSET